MKSLLLLSASLFLISCKSGTESVDTSAPDTGSEVTASQGGTDIIIETSMGTIRAKLHDDTAPITVANFLSYIDDGFYDETIFHRVIPNFMIQGGGFQISSEVAKEKPTGDGIKNESPKTKSNARGTLAMARTGNPDSATAQFFINVEDNNSATATANLDYPNSGGHGYAVFGEVIEGMEVVDQIKAVTTSTTSALTLTPDNRYVVSEFSDVPFEPVIIKSIRRVPKS